MDVCVMYEWRASQRIPTCIFKNINKRICICICIRLQIYVSKFVKLQRPKPTHGERQERTVSTLHQNRPHSSMDSSSLWSPGKQRIRLAIEGKQQKGAVRKTLCPIPRPRYSSRTVSTTLGRIVLESHHKKTA